MLAEKTNKLLDPGQAWGQGFCSNLQITLHLLQDILGAL